MYSSKPKWIRPGGKEPQPSAPARIHPDRRWFGNTRVIDQQKLAAFREDIQKASADPYTVVLKRAKLPMSLIKDGNVGGQKQAMGPEGSLPKLQGDALVALEPFEGVFGSKKTRKRPRLQAADLATLASQAAVREAAFTKSTGTEEALGDSGGEGGPVESIYQKGTSRRIWGELYKVIDASDVLVQVVDARDPMGTRRLERYLKGQRSAKHLVLVINKASNLRTIKRSTEMLRPNVEVDLVPPRVARHWLQQLSKEMPTLLMQADKNKKNIGRTQLFQLLREKLDHQLFKEQTSLQGSPDTRPGWFYVCLWMSVSSFRLEINLHEGFASSNRPAEAQKTRVWQYVALTSKLYLIDCPGIVPLSSEAGDDTAKVMRGVVRPERINAPEEHIATVLERVKREAVIARYGLDRNVTWGDSEEFLALLAVRLGKLRKGGEPDISTTARIVLYDLQRGKLPYYVLPPTMANEAADIAGDREDAAVDGALALPEGNALQLANGTLEALNDEEKARDEAP
ncbi:nucleolar GTP-binding protein [Cyclospora cayetanensis]|uniref:Nucleolar GTP-binding protein 2 n=1 Tax=Cyclospora cayetanensis TaxID=88456 RepID=A0A1D3CRR3_9EIME|nr:nucleolar GTP-binding protein [Cyclospora cayetanensis]